MSRLVPSRYQDWWYALPFSVVGAVLAAALQIGSFRAHVERERVRTSSSYVCGLPFLLVIPATATGAWSGAVIGVVLSRVIRWQGRGRAVPSTPLFGSREETNDRFRALIPLGTPLLEARRLATEAGVGFSVHVDPVTNESFLWCVYGDLGPGSELQVWQVRIDFARGGVSAIECLQAGPHHGQFPEPADRFP